MPQIMTKASDEDSQTMTDLKCTGETAETGAEPQAKSDSKQEQNNRKGTDVRDSLSAVAAADVKTCFLDEVAVEAEGEADGKLSKPEKSPVQGSLASSSDVPPEGSRVPLDLEQRQGGSADCTKTETPSPSSVDLSCAADEPLSRMDSEDSLSSSLMELQSMVSSGRSTPALLHTYPAGAVGGSVPLATFSKSLSYTCCWDQCQLQFPCSPDLAEHIRATHVDGQRGGVFVCLWKGCKVYNTPSTSQSWLQRHMLSHSGDKPFKCVVGGCTATFASQGGLARHVPTHFSYESSTKVSSHSKMKEESPSKAGLNKRRKLRNKLKRSLPRPHDFFDAQTMDAIRHRAICLNLATHIESLGSGHSVVFHSTVIARRKEDSGKVKVLLHWTPEDILPDVWVSESERLQQKTRVVHLSKLPTDTAVLLDPNIYRMFF